MKVALQCVILHLLPRIICGDNVQCRLAGSVKASFYDQSLQLSTLIVWLESIFLIGVLDISKAPLLPDIYYYYYRRHNSSLSCCTT